MAKKIIKIVLLVVLAGALIYGAIFGYQYFAYKKQVNAAFALIEQIKEAGTFNKDFAMVGLDGTEYGPEIFADADVTILNFWANDCNPCVSEIPDLNEIAGEYKDKGFQLIGVCSGTIGNLISKQDDATKETMKNEAREIIDAIGVDNYVMGVPTDEFGLNLVDSFLRVYPTNVVLDKNGEIIDVFAGGYGKAEWIEKIDAYLAQVQG